MKLSSLVTAEAESAILAHTMRLPDGVVLKKGRVLSRQDVEALIAAGHGRVVAACLEPGDMAEDAAAAEIAAAAAGTRIRVAEAFTGRANLFARSTGLVAVDRARIDAMNRIDEAITLATVAPYTVVVPGDMVATAKIIPFAVPASAVAACRRALADGAISIHGFINHRAALVLTRLPGVKERVLDRAAGNMRVRLSRLGSELAREIRCDHDIPSVTASLRELLAARFSPILLLGASAIVDRADIIPSAVERAGGRIDHFGMPVDPGNLLLLGRAGDTTLLGVPGCARSLKSSGFDWVLERVIAGVAVTADDIRAMGVGGLLADIGSRPHPRKHPARDDEPSPATSAADEESNEPDRGRPVVAAVVLAAGQSRRMGAQNKLVAEVAGKAMVTRVVDALLASSVERVIVVTGHEPDAIAAALGDRPVERVHNPDFAQGMSTSLAAGIAAIEGQADAALVCLGDMPWIAPEHVQVLIEHFNPLEGRAICVPVHGKKPGNPVLFARELFSAMKAITGDTGARGVVRDNPDLVHQVPMTDSAVIFDLDTADALATLQAIDRAAELPESPQESADPTNQPE